MSAKKIRILIRIGNFILPIPSLKIKTVKGFVNFGLKHLKDIQMPQEDLNVCMEELFQTLSHTEPFELVNVDAIDKNGKKVKVLIKTI
ncbi:MAG: hypothetical protein GX285_04840 [Clostridiales bacterium]|nr:hypothetical protein [Clostridiales bacterium]